MSQTGKDDQGRIGALGNYAFAQQNQDQDNANQQFKNGTNQGQIVNAYYNQQLHSPTGGAATQAQNWAAGNTAMPGVDAALAQQQKNLGQTQTNFNNFQNGDFGAANTTDALNNQADWGIKNQLQNTSGIKGDINSSYGAANGTNAGLLKGLNSDIGSEYSGLDKNLTGAYGGFAKATDSTYNPLESSAVGMTNALQGDSANSFGNSRNLMNLIMPGGQAQSAQVAQSFAPQIAATMDSLRKAGVDPNSPQAQQALEAARRGQAEGMDAALANSTNNYVNSGQQLNLADLSNTENLANNEQAAKERLGIGQLNTQLGLGTSENAQQQQNMKEQGALSQNALTNNANTAMGLDLSKLNSNTANTNNIVNLLGNYSANKEANTAAGRNMGLQDFGTQSNILNQNTAAAMNAPGFKNQEYNAGFNQNAYNTGLKQAAAQGLSGQEAENYATSLAYGSQALNANQVALKDYQTSLGIENANSDWGGKLLAGLGAAGLNMIAPGAGSIASGATGGFGTSLPSSQLPAGIATSGGGGSPVDWGGGLPMAKGGVVTQPTHALIGEAGYPEAVVPLKTKKTADKLKAMNVLPKRDFAPLRRAA